MDLRPVDEGNWQACAAIRPAPGQERFVAPVAWYLCMCHYEQTWRPLAIYAASEVVGYVMWAVDRDDGSYWIGGLVIDGQRQGEGNGRAAISALLTRFRDAGATEAALSYQPENARARALYASLAFRETQEHAEGEVIARLALRSTMPRQTRSGEPSSCSRCARITRAGTPSRPSYPRGQRPAGE